MVPCCHSTVVPWCHRMCASVCVCVSLCVCGCLCVSACVCVCLSVCRRSVAIYYIASLAAPLQVCISSTLLNSELHKHQGTKMPCVVPCTVPSWHPGDKVLCYHGTQVPSMVPWCHSKWYQGTTKVPWHHAAIVPWSLDAIGSPSLFTSLSHG